MADLLELRTVHRTAVVQADEISTPHDPGGTSRPPTEVAPGIVGDLFRGHLLDPVEQPRCGGPTIGAMLLVVPRPAYVEGVVTDPLEQGEAKPLLPKDPFDRVLLIQGGSVDVDDATPRRTRAGRQKVLAAIGHEPLWLATNDVREFPLVHRKPVDRDIAVTTGLPEAILLASGDPDDAPAGTSGPLDREGDIPPDRVSDGENLRRLDGTNLCAIMFNEPKFVDSGYSFNLGAGHEALLAALCFGIVAGLHAPKVHFELSSRFI